jgi:hypothetical protein
VPQKTPAGGGRAKVSGIFTGDETDREFSGDWINQPASILVPPVPASDYLEEHQPQREGQREHGERHPAGVRALFLRDRPAGSSRRPHRAGVRLLLALEGFQP